MQPEGSLLSSEEPGIESYPKPLESKPQPHTIVFLRCLNIILPSMP